MNPETPLDDLINTLEFLDTQDETGLFTNKLDSYDLYRHLEDLIEKSEGVVKYVRELEDLLEQTEKHRLRIWQTQQE